MSLMLPGRREASEIQIRWCRVALSEKKVGLPIESAKEVIGWLLRICKNERSETSDNTFQSTCCLPNGIQLCANITI